MNKTQTNTGWVLACTLTLGIMLAGCLTHLQDDGPGPEPAARTARPPKADALEGSCANPVGDSCGGPSIGACWCDELCESFGDCCADKVKTCDGPARIRMADSLRPGGRGYPVYLDLADPELSGVPFEMELSRQTAGSSSAFPTKLGAHVEHGGWLVGANPHGYIAPCDGVAAESCLGPLEVRFHAADESHRLLASRTVQVEPADRDDGLAAGGCRGVGNVASYNLLKSYAFKTGRMSRTVTLGKWNVSFHHEPHSEQQRFRLSAIVRGNHGDADFDMWIPTHEPGVVFDVSQGDKQAALFYYDGACGHGQMVLHELELGEAVGGKSAPEGGSSSVKRVTLAWKLECTAFQGGQPVPMPLLGCIHYDADNPVYD